MLFDINHSNILFDPPPRIMTVKTHINQWDLITLKSFCTAKETIKKKRKDNPQNGRKIFTKEATEKGLIFKLYGDILMYKHLIQLYIKTKKAQNSIQYSVIIYMGK